MQDTADTTLPARDALGNQIIARLRRRKLPQMVDWFDPLLLAKVGVREVVSGTLGQYADQRLTQATTDRVTEEELVRRYDYSEEYAEYAKDGLWVDYISDLGDGFEATYAMAYLMAPETLDVKGTAKGDGVRLPAGRILVMGGDQAYPQSSVQEYQDRFVDPYNWAFTTETPRRKLFALPGNHDWYDGLAAFDRLLCSARFRISGGIGKQIGGWRCHQHRSYFAIRLPNDWWIWGADIQLEGVLDDAQRDYFDLLSRQVQPGHKVVICLAEPSWLHKNYDNLHQISMLARKHGGTVCAVLAGDWHHYSRYAEPRKKHAPPALGVQFITCGGGGAFAHATHSLDTKLNLQWPEVTASPTRHSDPKDPLDFNRMEKDVVKESDNVDFSLKSHALRAETIYPSKTLSRLLSLKNLWLPFHNRRFTVFVGLIYFIFAWVFSVSISSHVLNAKLGEVAISEALRAKTFAWNVTREGNLAENAYEALRWDKSASSDAIEAAKSHADAATAAANSATALARSTLERAKALNSARNLDDLDGEIEKALNLANSIAGDLDRNVRSALERVRVLSKLVPQGNYEVFTGLDRDLSGLGSFLEVANSLDVPALDPKGRKLKLDLEQLVTKLDAGESQSKEAAAKPGVSPEIAQAAADLAEACGQAAAQAREFQSKIDGWAKDVTAVATPGARPAQSILDKMEFEASKLSFRALGDFVPQRTDSPAKADNEWQVAARAASAALSTYTTALRKKEIIVANKAITPVKEKITALVAINTALVEKMNLASTSEADAQKRSALEDGVRKLKDETQRAENFLKQIRPWDSGN